MRVRTWPTVVAALVAIAGSLGATADASGPATGAGAMLGPWKMTGRSFVLSAIGDQGLASVTGANGKSHLVFRGDLSIPVNLKRQGWNHIGDPGSWGGYVVDAYQHSWPTTEKMFHVTTPSGKAYDFVHRLAPGEKSNNSFVTVAPGDQWMVSGEWGQMNRLLVFPSPIPGLSSLTGKPAPLALAATISLDQPVRDVQGCAFVTATELLCSTDDQKRDLWPTPDQLLEVTLPQPLDGSPVDAQVTSLGELPRESLCKGTFEVEGIDFQAPATLRVEVEPPGKCGLLTTVYTYHKVGAALTTTSQPATSSTSSPSTSSPSSSQSRPGARSSRHHYGVTSPAEASPAA